MLVPKVWGFPVYTFVYFYWFAVFIQLRNFKLYRKRILFIKLTLNARLYVNMLHKIYNADKIPPGKKVFPVSFISENSFFFIVFSSVVLFKTYCNQSITLSRCYCLWLFCYTNKVQDSLQFSAVSNVYWESIVI